MPTKFQEKIMSLLSLPLPERIVKLKKESDLFVTENNLFVTLHLKGQHLLTFTDKSTFSKLYYALTESTGNKTQILRSLPALTEIAEQFSAEYLQHVSVFYHVSIDSKNENSYTGNVSLVSLLEKMSMSQEQITLHETHEKELLALGFEYPATVNEKEKGAGSGKKFVVPAIDMTGIVLPAPEQIE